MEAQILMDLTNIKVGDILICRDVNESKARQQRALKFPVTRVGRKYLVVGGKEYDRKTGRINDNYGHAWLQTVDEYEAEKTMKNLTDKMYDLKIQLDLSKSGLSNASKIKVFQVLLSAVENEVNSTKP